MCIPGTVGFDVVTLVKKYKNGVEYNMYKSLVDPKLGLLQVPIGLVCVIFSLRFSFSHVKSSSSCIIFTLAIFLLSV